jgi:hypothetical protein
MPPYSGGQTEAWQLNRHACEGQTAATKLANLSTEKLETEIFLPEKSFCLHLWPAVISLQNLFTVGEEVAP